MDIKEVIIVEGKYDKIKLDSFIDATVIQTDGFKIFKDKDKKALIKQYAEKRGIIILTDSDSAGLMIRNHLKSFIDQKYIKNAYIPQIKGKEKRKTENSKEGFLGVEGLTKEIILDALKSVTDQNFPLEKQITKTDLISDGLSGSADSKEKRLKLLKLLKLPQNLNTTSLLDALNTFLGYEKYKEILHKIK